MRGRLFFSILIGLFLFFFLIKNVFAVCQNVVINSSCVLPQQGTNYCHTGYSNGKYWVDYGKYYNLRSLQTWKTANCDSQEEALNFCQGDIPSNLYCPSIPPSPDIDCVLSLRQYSCFPSSGLNPNDGCDIQCLGINGDPLRPCDVMVWKWFTNRDGRRYWAQNVFRCKDEIAAQRKCNEPPPASTLICPPVLKPIPKPPTPTETPETPTPTPTAMPTPTPAPKCGDICYGDSDCPLAECSVCDFIEGCTKQKTCCVDLLNSKYCVDKWSGDCLNYCPSNLTAGDRCEVRYYYPCTGSECTNLNPSKFEISPNQGKWLNVRAKEGSCGDTNFSYHFYASPLNVNSELVAAYENQSWMPQEKYGLPYPNWDWSFYREFKPSKSGYLDKVEVFIGRTSDDLAVEGYFSVIVTDNTGRRLTDNTGIFGGEERYIKSSGFWQKFPYNWSINKLEFYIRPYLVKDQTYRLYVNPRPGQGSGSFWVGDKNTRQDPNFNFKEHLYYRVYLTPSETDLRASFSDITTSENNTLAAAKMTIPDNIPQGTKYRVVAEVSDSKSVDNLPKTDPRGSGTCLGEATVIIPSPTPTPVPRAWFQIQNCDAHSNGKFVSKIPKDISSPYLINSSPGGIVSSSEVTSQIDLGQSRAVSKDLTNWKLNNYQSQFGLKSVTFNYLKNQTGLLFTDDSKKLASNNLAGLSAVTGPLFTLNDLTIDSPQNLSGKRLIIFVGMDSQPKDLRINADITLDSSSVLLFVVSGNIYISPEVTRLDGIYFATKEIHTGRNETGPDHQLQINGNLITGSSGRIFLERDLGEINNLVSPAEIITCQPRYFVFLAELLRRPILSWQEVTP